MGDGPVPRRPVQQSNPRELKGERRRPDFDHHGEILEQIRPAFIAAPWYANSRDDPSHRSVVRWELTPTESTGTHPAKSPIAV